MSEWLDLMLDEVARKRREREDAMAELERRNAEAVTPAAADEADGDTAQSEDPSSEGK